MTTTATATGPKTGILKLLRGQIIFARNRLRRGLADRCDLPFAVLDAVVILRGAANDIYNFDDDSPDAQRCGCQRCAKGYADASLDHVTRAKPLVDRRAMALELLDPHAGRPSRMKAALAIAAQAAIDALDGMADEEPYS